MRLATNASSYCPGARRTIRHSLYSDLSRPSRRFVYGKIAGTNRARRKALRVLAIIVLAGLVGTCSSPPPLLDQVLETGELRVVTRLSPTALVEGPNGRRSGPEYDLVRAFADELGVELVVETVQSVSEVLPFMLEGDAHLAAAGLSTTPARRDFVNFGHPYDLVDMHLIYKLGTGKPRSIDDVLGRSIEVVAGTSHVDMLASLQTIYPQLSWVENADVEVADLLEKVAAGEIDFTIADSTEFNIQRQPARARRRIPDQPRPGRHAGTNHGPLLRLHRRVRLRRYAQLYSPLRKSLAALSPDF